MLQPFTLRSSSTRELVRVQIAMRGLIGSLSLFLATYAPSLPAQDSPVLVGRVFAVTDGDTIKVFLKSGPIKVRLHGIDALETC